MKHSPIKHIHDVFDKIFNAGLSFVLVHCQLNIWPCLFCARSREMDEELTTERFQEQTKLLERYLLDLLRLKRIML